MSLTEVLGAIRPYVLGWVSEALAAQAAAPRCWVGSTLKAAVPASGVRYNPPFSSTLTTANNYRGVAPLTGTLRGLRVKSQSGQPASGALRLEVLVNMAVTPLAVIIPAGATGLDWVNGAGEAAVTAGDTVVLRLTNLATTDSVIVEAWSMVLTGMN